MGKSIQVMGAAAGLIAALGTIPTYASTSVQYVETNHGWVSYHSQPALKSAIVGRLTLGQEALLLGKANAYWYQIQVNNQTVYITTSSTYTHVVTVSQTSSSSNTGSSTSGTPSTTTATSPTSTTTTTASTPTTLPTSTTTSPTPTTSPTTTSSPTPTTTSSTPSAQPSTTSAEPAWQVEADKVIAAGKTQLGVPYLWGKQEPGIGFDCSNFTAWCYKTALGISFSGSSYYQRYNVGTPVPLSQIREGDLLFFKTANNATGSGHVGIYAGNGYILQEGGGYAKVTYQPMVHTWFATNLVFARRVIN